MRKQFHVLSLLALVFMVGCEAVPTEVAEDAAPSLKKDGKPGGGGGGPADPVIAYNGNRDLRVINADGSNSTVVVPESQFWFSPSWSPLGNGTTTPYQIAYASEICGPLATVDITVVEGAVVASDITILDATADLACSDGPAWSPDGTEIAFNGAFGGDCSFDLFTITMPPDGSVPMQRTFDSCNNIQAWGPSWSPDGSAIAFLEKRVDENYASAIKVLHLDDDYIATVFDEADLENIIDIRSGLDWGRDMNGEQELVFNAIRRKGKGKHGSGTFAVYTLRLSKDASGHYSADSLPVWEVDGRRPSWSPDDNTRFVMDGLTIYDVESGATTGLARNGLDADWR
jgi:Tol biopolymer transport system component